MSYPTASRGDRRFIGNVNTTEVHDLSHEDFRANGCQVDEIIVAANAVGFTPDTLAQAHDEGFQNCAKCLGG